MKRSIIGIASLFFTFLLVLAQCTSTGGDDGNGGPDTTPPLPGGDGILIISNYTDTSVTLSWTKATDDVTAQSSLEYRVYYAYADLAGGNIEDIEANGTEVGEWEADIEEKTVTGLAAATIHYFVVLVRDGAGNTAAYLGAAGIPGFGGELPPMPGNGGTVAIEDSDGGSVTLSWTKATDDVTAREDLEYVVYVSTVDFTALTVFDPNDLEGTAFGEWEADIDTKTVTDLDPETVYWFVVLVRDEAGLTAPYLPVSQTTGLSIPGTRTITLDLSPDPPYVITKWEHCTWMNVLITYQGFEEEIQILPIDTLPFVMPDDTEAEVTIELETDSALLSGSITIPAESGSAEYDVQMHLDSTKLVLPDRYNYRLVQVDDMVGTGWKEHGYEDYDPLGINFDMEEDDDFQPMDADFDRFGYLYILFTYYDSVEDSHCIIACVNDMNDTFMETVVGPADTISAFCIDREAGEEGKGHLYYAVDGTITRVDLDGVVDDASYELGDQITGMCARDGYLYAVANTIDKVHCLNLVDDGEGGLTHGEGPFNITDDLYYPYDVNLIDGDLYITNYGNDRDMNEHPLVRYDLDESSQTTFGSFTTDGPTTTDGDFWGPELFVATANGKLYLMDSLVGPSKYRSVRAFDPEDIGNWSTLETYGEFGADVGYFKFLHLDLD